VISFKKRVVICTSNLGTKLIQDELLKDQILSARFGGKQKSKKLKDKDKKSFEHKRKVMVELTKFFNRL
jgi:ATP-dependent Clp protease ATP-binding subunit ClpA